MAYVTPVPRATGYIVPSAVWNSDVVENMLQTAVAKVTTAGDTVQATGANALARLAIGTVGQVYRVNASETAAFWSSSIAPPNRLVNGGFEIWQRGAGAFTADGAYTSDRWLLDEIGTDTLSVTRESTVKAPNSLYSLAAVFVLGSGAGATQIYQQLSINANEMNHDLWGKVISAAIEVDLAAGVASAVRVFVASDGTGGTTTYSAYHGNNTNLETLSVQNVTVPVDATYIRVGLAFAASCTAYMDNARVNVSPVYCDYVGLTPWEERARCQRYYESHGGAGGGFIAKYGYGLAAASAYDSLPFAVAKAVAPTMTKAGTWTVANCGQPAFGGIAATVAGYVVGTTITATANYSFQSDSGDDVVTAEANP